MKFLFATDVQVPVTTVIKSEGDTRFFPCYLSVHGTVETIKHELEESKLLTPNWYLTRTEAELCCMQFQLAYRNYVEPTPENLLVFVRKIADGKRLMKFSYMDGNVTCDCCESEERVPISGPDELQHKSWCIVTAARAFFPGFTPSDYPEDTINDMRKWTFQGKGNEVPQFAWHEMPATPPPQEEEPQD